MTPILVVSGLEVRRDAHAVVRAVSFTAARGERLVLMGPSGTGKTTVLRAIAGLEPFSSGSITVDGDRLAAGAVAGGGHVRERQRRVGMVFQSHHLFGHLTALHNVWLAPVHVFGTPRPEAEAHARTLLRTLGVGHRADAMPHELSGGEAQRVAVARALAMNPPVLLLDEPTASLDPGRRGELAAMVRELAADGTTLVIATHDAEFARSCAQRVLVLEDGRVTQDGPAAVLLS